MAETPLRRIKSVEPRSGYRIAVSWDQGPRMIVDLSDMIQKGGVFAVLRDESAFSRVRIGERSRTIEWPEPKDNLGYPVIDIDAESLFVIGTEQKRDAVFGQIINGIRSIGKRQPVR